MMSLAERLVQQLNLNTGLLGILVVIAGAILVALIRKWPEIKALTISESEQLRIDRRGDYAELKGELAQVKQLAENVQVHSQAMTIRLGQVEFVFAMVLDELELIAPGNEVAKRAHRLIATFFPLPPQPSGVQDYIDAMMSKRTGVDATPPV